MRNEWTRRFFVAVALAPLVAFAAQAPGATALAEGVNEAPYADRIGPAVGELPCGCARALRPAGVSPRARSGELKALGFRTIVDLRGPDEGVEAEGRAAEAAGLRYVNIPGHRGRAVGRRGGRIRAHRRGRRQ